MLLAIPGVGLIETNAIPRSCMEARFPDNMSRHRSSKLKRDWSQKMLPAYYFAPWLTVTDASDSIKVSSWSTRCPHVCRSRIVCNR